MAISSPLNPGTIVKERPTTAAAAQNFITGGSPLGSGVVASAANKIVGFQRGAAGVAARPPDLQSIIQTLSSNILNNVETRVQSINQNVTQLVNSNLKGLGDDYKARLGQIDAARPNSILSNFLNLYKEAIGYIQFLGNRKNVKTLGNNLKALQSVFAETFNIAKLIRQTILRIVKQLSGLPSASTGPGGINLDVNVPGGGLRRTLPKGVMKMMRRRPGMMLGGAALAGGLGSQVVSGMLDVGGDVQAAPMSEGTIPTTLLDRFNGILDRFSAAIDALARKKPSASPVASSSEGAAPPPPKDEKQPGGTPSGPAVMPESDQELYTLATIAGLESGTAQGQADVAQAVYNRMAKGNTTATDILTRTGQFEPAFTAPYKISKGAVDPQSKNIKTFDDAVKFRMKKTGEKREVAEAAIKSTVSNLQNVSLQQNAASFVGARTSFRGSPQNVGTLSNTVWRGSRSDNQFLNEELSGKGTAAVPGFVAGGSAKPTVATPTTPPKPTVTASTTQAATQQQLAQSVSQPPPQQQTQVTVAPMNMASPQAQSTPATGKAIPPPAMSKGGVSVPFLSSSNDDNFLSLYSKMVYNVIDG